MGASARPSPELPEQLRTVGDRLPVAAALVVLAGQLLPGGGWTGAAGGRVGWAVVTLGLLVGLPHGAVDHLLPAWVHARRTAPRPLAGLLATYVGVAAAMYGLLRLLPLAGLAAFLVLSVLHFGTGELTYVRLRLGDAAAPGGPGPTSMPYRTIAVLAWGGAPVVLALAVRPAQVAPVLDALAPGAGGLLTPVVTVSAVTVALTACAVTCTSDLLSGRRRQAGELALLAALFLLVPPLVAFACYFGAWHSLRHLVRLVEVDPANRADLDQGRLARPLCRFARQAAAPTAAALLALTALIVTTGGRQEVLPADLTLLAALTVPHLLAVAWLDRQPSARRAGQAAA